MAYVPLLKKWNRYVPDGSIWAPQFVGGLTEGSVPAGDEVA